MTLTTIQSSDVQVFQGSISSSHPSPEGKNVASRPGQVFEMTDQDVLLGRGTGPNESRGNIRFRALVRRALQGVEPSKLDGRLKARLAREILKAVKAENGRFLKINSDGNSPIRSFSVVSDSVALDKVKQSFRHQLRVLEDALSKGTVGTTPGSRHQTASPVTSAPRSTPPSSSNAYLNDSQYHQQESMSSSLRALLDQSNTNGLTSAASMNLNLVRDRLEKEIAANAIASQAFAASAAARRTMRETALSNALLVGDHCMDSSSMTDLMVINALATAKAEAALRQASSLPYFSSANSFGGLASLLRNNENPSLGSSSSLMMSRRLAASPTVRSSFDASNHLRDLESRIAAALAVINPDSSSGRHHQSLSRNNDTPHYLEMILRRGT